MAFRESFDAKFCDKAVKIPRMIVNVIVTQRSSAQTGRIKVYCKWFLVALASLLVVVGGFGWFWVFLGRFGWFHVLVTKTFCFGGSGRYRRKHGTNIMKRHDKLSHFVHKWSYTGQR